MNYRDWKVGDRIVCVNDDWTWKLRHIDGSELPVRVPMLNEVLEISRIHRGNGKELGGSEDQIYVGFAELDNQSNGSLFGSEFGWSADQFRLLQTRQSDISIFTAMLHGTDQKANA